MYLKSSLDDMCPLNIGCVIDDYNLSWNKSKERKTLYLFLRDIWFFVGIFDA